MRNKIIYVVIVCFTLLCLYDILKHPLLFKNVNSFVEKKENLNDLESINSEYLHDLISNIPYKEESNPMVYNILPKDKYHKTIQNGYGNCSNYSFGASYKFLNDKKEFYILNFYPKDRWKSGGGHTVILAKVANDISIIDVLEGGIVFNINPKIGIFSSPELRFKSFNKLKDNINPYFPSVFNYDMGLISDKSVKHYFDFIERIYYPLGNEKVEKYFYDGLAVYFGKYPEITVKDKDDLVSTWENFRFIFYLWWLRIFGLLVVLYSSYKIINLFRKY